MTVDQPRSGLLGFCYLRTAGMLVHIQSQFCDCRKIHIEKLKLTDAVSDRRNVNKHEDADGLWSPTTTMVLESRSTFRVFRSCSGSHGSDLLTTHCLSQ